jgi:gamma-glutamyl hercynylcysteine S-oxide synthase
MRRGFLLGVDAATEPFSLDNERPEHTVEVGPFWIGRVPVTNRQWREFIADHGYRRPELWSKAGWAHRAQAGLERPGATPSPVGAYPAGVSAYGAEQMIGDVWEWTSSDFGPWPGFTPMIYRRHSEPFFGREYKVLRGGSWAVAAPAIRPSFRNWDYPIRRQIFTGMRLAWDV